MMMPKMQPVPIKTKNNPLIVRIWRWITSIRKWVLTEDWTHKLPDGTTILIEKGFDFDGASIPRPLWALLSPVGLLLIPGLIHDYAYRYDYLIAVDGNGNRSKYKANAGRKQWDRLFREVGKDVNGLALIDMLAWLALSVGGWWAWYRRRKEARLRIRPRYTG
ncbi:MAG: DUF1353 domain-containing protein [Desulfosarcinaceae bacterium]|jgi:hypothetical protein